MTIEDLKLKLSDYAALISDIVKAKPDTGIADALTQYAPAQHKIFDTTKRPDKIYTDESSNLTTSPVARLAVPFQKQIAGRAATFLCGNPIQLHATPQDDGQKNLLRAVQAVWDDCKLDYKSKTVANYVFAETEAAELWYVEPLAPEDLFWDGILSGTAKFKLRMRILANSLLSLIHI